MDTFWANFGHFSYSTSINDSLTIEFNYLLKWISRIFFELNNILNWFSGKPILTQILNESFFGKKFKHWVELDRVSNTPSALGLVSFAYSSNCNIPGFLASECNKVRKINAKIESTDLHTELLCVGFLGVCQKNTDWSKS